MATAAAAIEVLGERRMRIRVFKHRCPVKAWMPLHLGTACSLAAFPESTKSHCQFNKRHTKGVGGIATASGM